MKITCNDCGTVVSEEKSHSTVNGLVCDTCNHNYCTCVRCEDRHPAEDIRTFCDDWYCNCCYDTYVGFCEDCEEDYLRVDLRGFGGSTLCPDCFDARRDSDTGIFHYDYQPDFVLYGKGDLHFGIELEIEFNNKDSSLLLDAAEHDYFFVKHDGSINDGAEVVSHPATFSWINEHFKETWGKVLALREKGMRSYRTETCGIHIHLSKKAFTRFHLYKFLRFIRENCAFVEQISQRINGNLDQWASLSSTESILRQARTRSTDERYVAVNLGNHNTIEIRIFRGNLKESGFRKNIEFCKALYDFTAGESCSNLTAVHFQKYILKNKKGFPNLNVFIQDWDIVGMKRVPTENGKHKMFPCQREKNDWDIDEERREQEWFPEEPPVPTETQEAAPAEPTIIDEWVVAALEESVIVGGDLINPGPRVVPRRPTFRITPLTETA